MIDRDSESGEGVEPYELEKDDQPERPPEKSSGQTSDDESEKDVLNQGSNDAVCSSCGSPESESGEEPCVACGHDQTTGKTVGNTEGMAEAPAESPLPALVGSPATHVWLILAGLAALGLLVAWLMGWESLFARSDGKFLDRSGEYALDAPRFALRMAGVLRWCVAGATLVGIGLVALRFTAMLAERSIGAWPAATSRLCCIVAIAGLATLVPVQPSWLEWTVQLVVGCGLATLGAFLLLGLRWAWAGIFLGTTALLLVALVPLIRLITWSFGF